MKKRRRGIRTVYTDEDEFETFYNIAFVVMIIFMIFIGIFIGNLIGDYIDRLG